MALGAIVVCFSAGEFKEMKVLVDWVKWFWPEFGSYSRLTQFTLAHIGNVAIIGWNHSHSIRLHLTPFDSFIYSHFYGFIARPQLQS